MFNLLTSGTVRDFDKEEKFVVALNPAKVIDTGSAEEVLREVFGQLPCNSVIDHISRVLREPLRPLLPQDYNYENCFDRFEYLLALVYADLAGGDAQHWVPTGRRRTGKKKVIDQLDKEAEKAGGQWPPLKAGFFGGSMESFSKAREIAHSFLDRYGGL